MFVNRLYREEAVVHRWKAESLDDLLRVTAPHEWAIVATLAAVLLGVVAWGLLGSVERALSADCVLARPGERHAILAGVSGTVVDVLVRTRDTVEPGQAIARVRLPEVDRQARIARARVDVLEAQPADTPGPDARLRAARTELRELDAAAQAGGLVVSSHAGEVTAVDLVPGRAVTAGTQVAEIRTGGDHRLQAVALVDPADARRLDAGMAARVLIPADDDRDETWVSEAGVGEVSSRPVAATGWLARPGLPAHARGHLIRLDFEPPPAPETMEGQPCRLQVVMQRHPPVSLLLPAGSD